MERPTILLAVAEGADAYVDALTKAGFEPVSVDPAHVHPRVERLGSRVDQGRAADLRAPEPMELDRRVGRQRDDGEGAHASRGEEEDSDPPHIPPSAPPDRERR